MADRTLVAGFCGVGDMMFFLPTLHGLQQLRRRGETLDLLATSSGVAQLFLTCGLFDNAYVAPATKDRSWRGRLATLQALRRLGLPRYRDVIWPFAFTSLKKRIMARMISADRHVMHAPLTRTGRLPLSLPETWLPYSRPRHARDLNLDMLAPLGLPRVDPPTPLLAVPSDVSDSGRALADRYRADRTDAPLVVIHPVANAAFGSDRQWPLRSFVSMANALTAQRPLNILWIGGPVEREMLEEARAGTSTPSNMAHDLSLLQLAALLGHADLVIGNDSGMVHLAAAVGTPRVIVHGPSDPGHTGAWWQGALSLRADLPCSPCFDIGFSDHCTHKICLTQLAPGWVAGQVAAFLAGGRARRDEAAHVASQTVDTESVQGYQQFLTTRREWETVYERNWRRLNPDGR